MVAGVVDIAHGSYDLYDLNALSTEQDNFAHVARYWLFCQEVHTQEHCDVTNIKHSVYIHRCQCVCLYKQYFSIDNDN